MGQHFLSLIILEMPQNYTSGEYVWSFENKTCLETKQNGIFWATESYECSHSSQSEHQLQALESWYFQKLSIKLKPKTSRQPNQKPQLNHPKPDR